MDEEASINWEEEAFIYQKALEAALEYQRQLEERIGILTHALEQNENKVREDEQVVQSMRKEKASLEKRIYFLDRMTQKQRERWETQSKDYQKLLSDHQLARADIEKMIKERNDLLEEKRRLTQMLHLQQRLLREQREPE